MCIRDRSTREVLFGNSKVRFQSASDRTYQQPPPFAYAYCVKIPGSIGLTSDGTAGNHQDLPAKLLVFGGQILNSKDEEANRFETSTIMKACSNAWELTYAIEETELELDNFGGISHVKAGIISQRQQGSSAYAKVSLRWEKRSCSGTPPPTGGYTRGVTFLNDTVYALSLIHISEPTRPY